MRTVRVSDKTYQSLVEEKHGTDTFDDVIMKAVLRSRLLNKLPPSIKDMLMTREATPCQT